MPADERTCPTCAGYLHPRWDCPTCGGTGVPWPAQSNSEPGKESPTLSPAALAFLGEIAPWLPKDELERARVGLAELLKRTKRRVVLSTAEFEGLRQIVAAEPTGDLPEAAEAFLRAHSIDGTERREMRADLAALLETARAEERERVEKPPTFRFRTLTAVAGEAWVPLAWWIDLQPVLAEVAKAARAEEREVCAAHIDVDFSHPGREFAAAIRGMR